MTQDCGERWGNPPLLHPGMPGRAKDITDSTATHTSLPCLSRTHWHTLDAQCWLRSPQGHYAVSHGEDACICIASESPHSLHSTKKLFLLFFVVFFFLQDCFCRASFWRGAAQHPGLPPVGQPAPSDETSLVLRETALICLRLDRQTTESQTWLSSN